MLMAGSVNGEVAVYVRDDERGAVADGATTNPDPLLPNPVYISRVTVPGAGLTEQPAPR